jgi:hypothetical protein
MGKPKMLWYVSQDRKTEGPLSEQRLSMLIHWGKVTRRAYVCDEQFSGWVSIERTAFAPLLAEQPEAPEPKAPGVLRGGPLRLSTRALQRLGAVVAAVSVLAGALALMDGLASSRISRESTGPGVAELPVVPSVGPRPTALD